MMINRHLTLRCIRFDPSRKACGRFVFRHLARGEGSPVTLGTPPDHWEYLVACPEAKESTLPGGVRPSAANALYAAPPGQTVSRAPHRTGNLPRPLRLGPCLPIDDGADRIPGYLYLDALGDFEDEDSVLYVCDQAINATDGNHFVTGLDLGH